MAAFILSEDGEVDLQQLCQGLSALETMFINVGPRHVELSGDDLAVFMIMLRERAQRAHAAARRETAVK